MASMCISENMISINDVGAHVSKMTGRKPLHINTTRKWYTHGCRGVKLESVLIGGRRYASAEAIERFLEKINHSAVSRQ